MKWGSLRAEGTDEASEIGEQDKGKDLGDEAGLCSHTARSVGCEVVIEKRKFWQNGQLKSK